MPCAYYCISRYDAQFNHGLYIIYQIIYSPWFNVHACAACICAICMHRYYRYTACTLTTSKSTGQAGCNVRVQCISIINHTLPINNAINLISDLFISRRDALYPTHEAVEDGICPCFSDLATPTASQRTQKHSFARWYVCTASTYLKYELMAMKHVRSLRLVISVDLACTWRFLIQVISS